MSITRRASRKLKGFLKRSCGKETCDQAWRRRRLENRRRVPGDGSVGAALEILCASLRLRVFVVKRTGFTAKTQRREESRKEAKMEIKTTKSSKEPSDSAPEKGHSLRRKTVQRAYRSLPRRLVSVLPVLGQLTLLALLAAFFVSLRHYVYTSENFNL